LKLLENTGIVECQRQGLWANYNIKSNLDYSIKQIINNVVSLLKDDERIIEDRLKVNSIRRKNGEAIKFPTIKELTEAIKKVKEG
jgi:hypothetical protein